MEVKIPAGIFTFQQGKSNQEGGKILPDTWEPTFKRTLMEVPTVTAIDPLNAETAKDASLTLGFAIHKDETLSYVGGREEGENKYWVGN